MEDFKEVTPDFVPLLDVIFQLVMFFLINMSFVERGQYTHDIKLPVAQAAAPLDVVADEWIYVNINRSGQLKVLGVSDTELDSQAELTAYFTRKKLELQNQAKYEGKKASDPIVVLRADKKVPYSRVYEILDSCSRVGFRNWQMRVETPYKKQ